MLWYNLKKGDDMKYNVEKDSKKFYSGKQDDYSKYRPTYPIELFDFLSKEYNIKNKELVELGAGTGIFSKIVSSYCQKLYYVEPNADMINKGKDFCKDCSNIEFINKSAESTELPEKSVDMILAVQSFHWFDKTNVKKEVNRILKPNGDFAIIWNDWEADNNTFGKEYFSYISTWNNKLTGKKYQHKNVDDRKNFFQNGKYKTYTFSHSKNYTLNMVIGLSKSLSYAPKEGDEYYNEFIEGIIDIFNKYKKDDIVRFDFNTEMYIGKI